MKLLPENVLDDNGESENGFVAIEATIEELAQNEVGTACGHQGNKCFVFLKTKGYADRLCRGWYDDNTKEVGGMFIIECESNEDAEALSAYASEVGGSLRPNGFASQPMPHRLFYLFEIE